MDNVELWIDAFTLILRATSKFLSNLHLKVSSQGDQ